MKHLLLNNSIIPITNLRKANDILKNKLKFNKMNNKSNSILMLVLSLDCSTEILTQKLREAGEEDK